ncbi:MAG: Tol biopolymer transport system component [Rhodothermales bacterium]|jgi:Tol biopolymer transport system component
MSRLKSAILMMAGLVLAISSGNPLAAQSREGSAAASKKPLVLTPDRKAEFTATEVTWMSLDVSPDGQTIVFDMLGDIWTMPIRGGEATQITDGLPMDVQPRFSPDGETLVFVSDRSGGDNVWTMRMDFSDTTQVTQGNGFQYVSPEWMPDGEHVIASRSGGLGGAAKLYMYNVSRRSPIPLVTTPAQSKITGATPAPDGRYIWYASGTNDWNYNARFPQYQLVRYDRDTGQSLGMTNRYGSGMRPALSPDGRWLVYGSRENAQTGLRKRELATGREEWLAYPVQRDDMESRARLDLLPGYSFTPDSEAIIASYGGKVWRIPIDGSAQTEIPFQADVKLDVGPEVKFAYKVDTAAAVTAKQIRHPVLSPDETQMVFEAFDRLWLKAMPDGEARRLTTQDVGEFHAVWAPDGRSVAYATWDDVAGGHIMTTPVNAVTTPTQLTTAAALYYNLAWSPDGERVVATRAAARELKVAPDVFFGPLGGQFVWVPRAGGDATVISPSGSRDVMHFRQDQPDRIYAYSPREGLVSFRWDGTDVKMHLIVRGAPAGTTVQSVHPEEYTQLPRRVFPTPVDVAHPEEADGDLESGAPPPPAGLVLMSPQGGRAVAQVGMQIYTVDVVDPVGTPPTIIVANPASAPVEVRKLTDVGGEFPSWSTDGTRITWALGNALFSYDLDHVQAEEDSVIAWQRGDALVRVRGREINDLIKSTRAKIASLEKPASASAPDSSKATPDEAPPDSALARSAQVDSLKTTLSGLRADSLAVTASSLKRAIAKMQREAEDITALADSVRGGLDAIPDPSAAYKAHEQRIKVTMARDVPEGTVVLRGGRVLTMKEHEIIENADVVVTDNRIVAIGPRGEVDVPDGAEIIDVTGKTLIPGFVDTHYHPQWLVPEVHSTQAWQFLTTLAFGVTTTRDPQTAFTDVLSYADRVETGTMLGPRIYHTGPGVFLSENIRSAEMAESVLKRYSEYFDTKTLKMYMSGNRQQRQWIIAAAKKHRIMPTTEGGLDFKLNITHALDGYPGIEHALPIAPIFMDVVELFKASQTTNSPTLLVSYGAPFGENYFYATENVHDNEKLQRFTPHESIDTRSRRRGPGAGGSPGQAGWFLPEEYVFSQHAGFAKQLIENGARAGVGSHGQLQGLGYHWELWAMGSGGMSTHDALRAATIYGAEAIGFGNDLGSLEAGKLADILVIDGDPLEDLRNSVKLQYIMKNGRLYDGNTMDEVWPRQQALPDFGWRNLGPAGVSAGIRD